VAESAQRRGQLSFLELPVLLPETANPDTNVYDMRLVKHEDGYIYGLFCTERKDPGARLGHLLRRSAMRHRPHQGPEDLGAPRRLEIESPQQRNVVLHPEFVDGKYAFYTRPQDDFIQGRQGGGIGWGLSSSIENAVIESELIMDNREYHTIQEVKNGLGPRPSRRRRLAAPGARRAQYRRRPALRPLSLPGRPGAPWVITHKPAGYFIAPEGEERVGDVSNVVFSNGWIEHGNGNVLIYYASSDTRLHVAASTVSKLLDYVLHTPPDRSAAAPAWSSAMS